MFDRYTAKARRVIFFARNEASELGGNYIETEHLLLGVMQVNDGISRYLPADTASNLRAKITAHSTKDPKLPTNADMPLTEECKRVLNRASEEAEGLGHNFIGSGHILLGLLGEEGCYAAGLLRNHGIELTEVRKEVSESLEPPFERSV